MYIIGEQRNLVQIVHIIHNWVGKHSSNIWNLVPLCLMWTISREQNHHMFEDPKTTGTQLLALYGGSLFHWS